MASSTRFATISEAQLDELVESMDAKNKKRPTLSAGRVFESYLQEKDEEEPKTDAEICDVPLFMLKHGRQIKYYIIIV